MDDRRDTTTLRVVNFNPGIRGISRAFKVRVMAWEGQLWLVEKDVGTACGWSPDTLRHRRGEVLDGTQWGYASVPTSRGRHMMPVVSKAALCGLLKGSKSWQARRFHRWLDVIAL